MQTTNLRTLWSETLFEMLHDAIQHGWSSHALKEILVELHHKGYKLNRVVKKLNKRFGDESSEKLLERIRKK